MPKDSIVIYDISDSMSDL